MDNQTNGGYTVTKKMKIAAGVTFLVTFIFMIFFLVSVLAIKNNVVIIIATILFVGSVLVEGYVLLKILGVWYKNYTEKYKGL
ncbi:MAG: hypothetical protein K6G48_06975 [Acholeplasmatales bacterium]|nr:hypothetical protein [Acholeplasmatales bacterium]